MLWFLKSQVKTSMMFTAAEINEFRKTPQGFAVCKRPGLNQNNWKHYAPELCKRHGRRRAFSFDNCWLLNLTNTLSNLPVFIFHSSLLTSCKIIVTFRGKRGCGTKWFKIKPLVFLLRNIFLKHMPKKFKTNRSLSVI